MKYKVERDTSYDFLNSFYKDMLPNIHRYPATMLPQIGNKLLKDFNIKQGKLLDPYCGSGSSFASALDNGIVSMDGFDINPLAILISKVKFTKINKSTIMEGVARLRDSIYELMKNEDEANKLEPPMLLILIFGFHKR